MPVILNDKRKIHIDMSCKILSGGQGSFAYTQGDGMGIQRDEK